MVKKLNGESFQSLNLNVLAHKTKKGLKIYTKLKIVN